METLPHHSNRWLALWWMGLFMLAAVGFGMVLYATVWGAGWVADSYQYIGAARNLAHRGVLAYPGSGGYLVPLAHYPPAFSIALAVFEWWGLDAYATVRYFHASLFGLTIILVGITVFRVTRSSWGSLFAALLTLFSAALLERHAWALSEPLFIAATLGGFLLVDAFYQTNRKIFLIYSLICLTIAWLTRYVGVVAIVTLICVLIFFRQQEWKQTLLSVGLTILIPTVPMLLWMVRNFQAGNQFFNRNPTYTPLGTKNWLSIIQTLAEWILPDRIVNGREKWLVIGGIIALVVIMVWWLSEGRRRKVSSRYIFRSIPLIPLYVLFGVLYIPVVILSKLFFDPMIGFTERILIPTQLVVLIVFPILLTMVGKHWGKIGKIIAILVAFLLLLYYTNESVIRLQKLHKQGLGVANRRWHESQVIKALQKLEEGRIFSNSLSTMYLWRREAGWYFTHLESYEPAETDELSYLVVFHYLQPNTRLKRLMEALPVLIEDRIATIYLYQPGVKRE
ncbi:MAG: phospholipid carrier-dependent glycosyltransferase [Anaerolineales bacterium]